ncbi:PAS domain-containing protein [Spirosoma arboris]
MGELTRRYDWTMTSLGTPDQWPQSLRTTLSILLNSRFPMFLFWGPEHLCFYNDAYRPSLGNDGKHPYALGKPGAQVWPEIWEFIKPLIDQVLAGQGATWNEDQLLPIYRNGQMEDVYWTFSYSPVSDESGHPRGVFVTCTETTRSVIARQETQQAQRQILDSFEESPVGIAIINEENLTFRMANPFYGQLVGRTPGQLLGKPLLEALPEIKGQGFEELLRQVIATGIPYIASETAVNLVRHHQPETIYVDMTYQPRREIDPKTREERISGVLVVVTDVTQQVRSRQLIADREARFRSLIEQAPVATGLFVGKNLTIELANGPMLRFWGKGPDVFGKPLAEVLPELAEQPFLNILDQVYTTGQAYQAMADRCDLVIDGQVRNFYFNFAYQPIVDEQGQVYAILDMAVDVTEQVLAQQALQESERFSRTVFYNSPVAKLVYIGEDMILREANEKMLAIFGRDASILGKPIMEAIPELKQTRLLEKYRRVLATGEIHVEVAERIELLKQGESYWGYYDYTYKPLFDTTGKPYGVIFTVIEVTEQVLDRQKLEETQASLRGAIELAQLGTWSIDVATHGLTYSDRLIEWFGYDPKAQDYTQVIPILDPSDQERVDRAIAWALHPESNGIYNEIYTVIHPQTGQRRVLHAQGKTVFDTNGKAVRLNGTAQDITIQRNSQLVLEQQVQERTEELAATNEELAAINEELEASNEEYAAINEELEEASGQLMRSNENLQRFAYVASHDLQEPLRKVQQFGDLLKSQYADQLGEGVSYLERMQSAASRMSRLIKDLLDFSRISTQRDTVSSVEMREVIQSVLTDLELRIQESLAVVEVDSLPIVEGDRSQLEQLFLNLVSNALKFHRAEIIPQIRIRSQLVQAVELPPSVKPVWSTPVYHRIDVIDNGIGFDEKYLDRLFKVFQRLHGRNEFAGTGIGLAICEKVASNHGGAITAHSSPGQGATFSVYLPA